ncbi:hypothetical protein P692DRAFT_20828101 [Suillus brevipes Sb2]|nr:hypothetical protein P692DRAFT_20828101 [Suillus brevipes Sb2]
MAERSKALESGSSPKGREFESHSSQILFVHGGAIAREQPFGYGTLGNVLKVES